MRARRASATFLLALMSGVLATPTLARAQSGILLEQVVGGLVSPVAITHAGDGSGRLFITLQPGRIVIYDGIQVLPTPFLDISPLVSCCGERGLLSVAFHPEYATNGYFFVNYTNSAGDTVIARYTVSADPDVADPSSAVIFLTIDQPFSNHNGGQLQFGPDGYLYIGMGDGGSAGDPGNRAQNPGTLLGKMLRIDVNGGPPYAIPPTNPFVATADFRDEIWALGLRNPWRFSFDRLTGDLFIADVGQDAWEEVNLQPATSPGGENYGWRRMEGPACFNPPSGCDTGSLTRPILAYGHALGCSITGGYRYRGMDYAELYGAYFYGDYCSGRIWRATQSGGTWTTALALDSSLAISTFGEDERGELYLAHHDPSVGAIYRVIVRTSGKDLRIEGLGLAANSVVAGSAVTASYNVANRGTVTVTEIYTDGIYLSRDATLGAGDVLIGTSHGHTQDLVPNATHPHAQAVTIPAGTLPGSYFVLVRADALGTVGEGNEGNNVAAIPVTVTRPGKDLVIEGLGLSASIAVVGSGVTVSYRVANRGTVTVTEVYTDRIYLSSDATLGAGDVLIGTSHGHPADLGPNATHAHTQAVTMPAATLPGSYFVLVQADALGTVSENNEGNNVTAVPLTVTRTTGRDLRIEALSLAPASVVVGATTTVSYDVANRGSITVTETYTDKIYLSASSALDGGDTLLATSHDHLADLGPNATHAHSQVLTIPANTLPGSYFVLVQADAFRMVGESNEGNNVAAIAVTVTRTTGKDLRIEGLSRSPGSVAVGRTTTVSYRVANRGTIAVTEVYTDRIYLSSNATLGGGDRLLGSSHGHTADVPPNATHPSSSVVTILAGIPPGNYFILVQADALGTVQESNEGNNVAAIPLTVTP